MKHNFQAVEIPTRMAQLPKDKRGYPIPANVMRDKDGAPHFTINDENVRQRQIEQDLCAICGTKLFRFRWLSGGPMSVFHPDGMFIDTPLHHECMQYAMQVCPYLAAPNYNKRIDGATLQADKAPGIQLLDPTVMDNRPPVFVALQLAREDVLRVMDGMRLFVKYLKPRRGPGKFRALEFWQNGRQLDETEAAPIITGYLQSGALGDLDKHIMPEGGRKVPMKGETA